MPTSFKFLLGLSVVLILATARGRSGAASRNPCATSADSAAGHLLVVRNTVAYSDSAYLAQLQLPFRTVRSVTLVRDSATCTDFIAAYNRLWPVADSARHIRSAYVFDVGGHAFALVERGGSVYTFFDRRHEVIGRVVGLH